MQVIIEEWAADSTATHCHEPEFRGIHSRSGSVTSDISPERFIKIGRLLGMITKHASWECSNCYTTCEAIGEVAASDADWIATARGQLEDEGLEETLDDDAVAVADYLAREAAAVNARECKNPWLDKGTHFTLKELFVRLNK